MSNTAHYSCSQPALYQVSSAIIDSLQAHLEQFGTFKKKYNETHIAIVKNALANAKSLPDYKMLLAQSEVNYINLSNALNECTAQWQKLKRYIKTAYPAAQQKQMLEQAGNSYYKKAIAKNWQSTNALLMAGKNFLHNQSLQLSANQNMPDTFAPLFSQAYAYYSKCLLTFQQSEKEIKLATARKIIANNSLFTIITEICQDGQQIFRTSKILKDQFVFNTILHKFTSPAKHLLHHSDEMSNPEFASINSNDEQNQNI